MSVSYELAMTEVQCVRPRPRLQRYLSEGHEPSMEQLQMNERRLTSLSLIKKRKNLTLRRAAGIEKGDGSGKFDLDNNETLDLLDLVARVQRSRLDDQRCELPPPTPTKLSPTTLNNNHTFRQSIDDKGSSLLLEKILKNGKPYPMLVLPQDGKYWKEGGDKMENTEDIIQNIPTNFELEIDETATCYRKYFFGKEHYNLLIDDTNNLGPILLSLRISEGGVTRIIIRLKNGTKYKCITLSSCSYDITPIQLAKQISDELNSLQNEKCQPILFPKSTELIATYDEHALVSTFKFGVVPQSHGQIKEEQLFSIKNPSSALSTFLELLGNKVKLNEHKGFRGGLDTQYGQTGQDAIFKIYKGREIMFHVAPLLPYNETDSQQLQRKRHIGNDIVTIIFQEENTPFAPDMIASHFLHVFIVVQPIDPGTPKLRYRISVAARESVPKFGPELPEPAIFNHGPELQEWLLTKLINAETAAYKSSTFASLQYRTRTALLTALTDELRVSTRRFLGEEMVTMSSAPSTPPAANTHTSGSRFIETVRKALTARNNKTKEPATPTKATQPVNLDIPIMDENDNKSNNNRTVLGGSSDISPSDDGDISSLSSGGDTGLESLFNLRTRSCSCHDVISKLKAEIAELQQNDSEQKQDNTTIEKKSIETKV